jgi:hypothetical protein
MRMLLDLTPDGFKLKPRAAWSNSACISGVPFFARITINVVATLQAARNILVGANLKTKICDLGLSREIAPGTSEDASNQPYYRLQNENTPLPLRWIAPEVLTNRMRFTTHSVRVLGLQQIFCT